MRGPAVAGLVAGGAPAPGDHSRNSAMRRDSILSTEFMLSANPERAYDTPPREWLRE
jgi:hypothetical protein